MNSIRRAFLSLVVVVLGGLLSGACSVNQGGELVFDSPTSPSTPVTTPVVPMPDPANGDFQLVTPPPTVMPGDSATVSVGKEWRVEQNSFCAEGLFRGVVFENDAGQIRKSRSAEQCKGVGQNNFNYWTIQVIDTSIVEFANHGGLKVWLATAKSISEWDRSEVQLRTPIARWSVE